jgi:hypothetical protein
MPHFDRPSRRVIALLSARAAIVLGIAGALAGAAGRSLPEGSVLLAAIGAFLAALLVSLLRSHPQRVLRAIIEAIFAGGAAYALAWMMKNALGAAWPDVLRFAISRSYIFASTLVFGVVAMIDLERR